MTETIPNLEDIHETATQEMADLCQTFTGFKTSLLSAHFERG